MTQRDPLLPDQGGRMVAGDPLDGSHTPTEDSTRRKGYQLFEQRAAATVWISRIGRPPKLNLQKRACLQRWMSRLLSDELVRFPCEHPQAGAAERRIIDVKFQSALAGFSRSGVQLTTRYPQCRGAAAGRPIGLLTFRRSIRNI